VKSIHTPEYRALLTWLRECRQTRGLSLRDVGALLDVPHSWVGKIETGERRLDVTEFVRLCRVLHADPHEGLTVVTRVVPYPSIAGKTGPLAYVAERRQK
jgi:transcriptional regulator with XRE-family HTH domain